MHLRCSRILSRQPVSPRASCFRHHISETQSRQNARELPKWKLSTPQSIADKTKKEKTDQGEEQTEVKTNSDPSKGCKIFRATYKYFHGHNNICSQVHILTHVSVVLVSEIDSVQAVHMVIFFQKMELEPASETQRASLKN